MPLPCRLTRLLAVFLLILSLTGCLTFGGARQHGHGTLTLQNQRTGERASVLYRLPGGSLDPAGLWQISYLMRDQRTGAQAPIDPRLLDYLVDVRSALGLPPQAVILITSGYRSPQSNAELRRRSRQVAENSLHLRGMALDFKIPGVPGSRVAAAARSLHRGGVAYYPSSDHVHIDSGPPRSWAAW